MNQKKKSGKNSVEIAISKDCLIVDTKREAKLLHRSKKKTKSNFTLMVCQNIVAVQKGYQDWFDLYHSIKKKIEHSLSTQLLQPPLSLLDQIFYGACIDGVSDIHLEFRHDKARVRFRVDGEMSHFNTYSKQEVFDDMMKFFSDLDMSNMGIHMHCSGSHTVKNHSFKYRMQIMPAYNQGMDVVIKMLYIKTHQHLDLAKLGYLPSQIEALDRLLAIPSGSIYIGGQTGSGKTTSLYAVCDRYEQISRKKVFTIEVDREIERNNFVQIKVPYTKNNKSRIFDYIPAIYTSINAGASMVALEELRDRSSIQAIHAGHNAGIKLITTLNSTSAIGIIDRLMVFEDLYKKLSKSDKINGLAYQKLMPCVCKHCSINLENYIHQPKENITNNYWLELWNKLKYLLPYNDLSRVNVRNMDGCNHCKFGIKNRIVVAEIIELNDELITYVRNGDLASMRKAWQESSDGNIMSNNRTGKKIDENCLYNVLKGIIALDDFEHNFSFHY